MFLNDGKKIIVSADDFGISRWANDSILKLAREKKLDRVEVMMSRNITPEQAKELLASGVKLDIHLHLAKDRLDFWQDHERKIETGAVKRGLLFFWRIVFGENQPGKVEKEWESQIEDFKKIFGKFPDGLSSHEHIHFFPLYFRVAARLYKKYSLAYMRFGKENFNEEKSQVCLIISLMKSIDRKLLRKFSFESSDIMVSFDWIRDFSAFINKLPSGAETEVVFHPEKNNEFDFLEKV